MADLKMYSFNVRGIRDNTKHGVVFRYLKKKYPSGIYLLQEVHCTEDIEKKWELEWKRDLMYFSHGTNDSCGVAILISELDIKTSLICKDDGGRFIALKVTTVTNEEFIVCNVYAPTRNKVQEQMKYINYVKETFSHLDSVHFVIGGDFNTVFDPKLDKQGGDLNCTNVYTDELVAFMEAYDLVDAIRLQFPNRKIFTRMQRKPTVLSRIDHWLVSSHLINSLKNANVFPGIKSDHSIIFLELAQTSSQRGRGFWKFNAYLLHDPGYVKKSAELIQNLKANTTQMIDKQLQWDYIKAEIRGYTMQYASHKNKERRQFKKKLENNLFNIQNDLNETMSEVKMDEYNSIKEELEKIEEIETKGAILRSKAKWTEAGERNSKYFFNLEKRNAVDKYISQLQLSDGSTSCDPKIILNEQRKYYSNLYSQINISPGITNSDIIKYERNTLSKEEKEICEGLITEQECLQSLKNMQNGKSPGCDGFTVDFYKFFWKDIKTFIVDSINYAFSIGELSVEQKCGIITVIPKKNKTRIILKNWHPISLLNTDYKILTKCLARRVHNVLPSIIDLDQTGFIKERYIGENIRTIADIIDYTSLKKQPGIILLLDFEKAFDTIKWSFIVKSLELFNFGETFIKWIKTIYCNAESTVVNNGNTCGFFKLHRGIRQGCPISPYLFIIAVELLANAIRKDNNIRGIWVDDVEFKISQLADDTTIFVSDFESVGNVLKLVDKFHQLSGLKLNLDKTVAKGIGSLQHYECHDKYSISWTDGPLCTLGITISNDPEVILNENFLPRLKVFDNILTIWHRRGLSLKGKVTILRALALPRLLYPMSVLPIPNKIVKIVDSMIFDFIWSLRKPKIKRDVVIQNIVHGGIKVPDFATMVEANRTSWIQWLCNDSNAKWKSILRSVIKPMSLKDFTESHLDDDSVNSVQIPFYEQIYNVWNNSRQNPNSKLQYLEQIIWKNKHVQLSTGPKKKKKKSVMWNELYSSGIVKIKDLISRDGQFIDLNLHCKSHHIKYNFIQTLSIRKAIPPSWMAEITLKTLSGQRQLSDVNFYLKNDTSEVNVLTASTKKIYDILILNKYVRPTALDRWQEIYCIDDGDWSDIFKQCYLCTRETKLQSLQYKIVHRIIPCKKWLHDHKVINSPSCVMCKEGNVDNIIHHFIECSGLNNFWIVFENWWNRTAEYQIKLNNKHILFGIYHDSKLFKNINYVILLAKWFIHKQVYLERKIDFFNFLPVLKSHLDTEKYICTWNGRLHIFIKQWSEIYECL